MKAHRICFNQCRSVVLQEISLPPLGDHDLLVQSICSAISPGTERLIYQGRFPANQAIDLSFPDQSQTFGYPMTFGYALVGKVIEVGAQVDAKIQGRHIFAFKPHQDLMICPLQDVILLPDDLDPYDGCFLANTETAINLVLDSQPLIGERVAVVGQGVVGLLTTRILDEFPIRELLAIDTLPKRLEQAKQWGARSVTLPTELESWKSHFDLVIEVSGYLPALAGAIELCAFNGRVIVGSWYGENPAAVALNTHFHRSRITLISSQVSTVSPQLQGRYDTTRRLDLAKEYLNRIKPSDLISHRFPFQNDRVQAAYQMLENFDGEHLQIVFTYS